jgi:hypothetical protein
MSNSQLLFNVVPSAPSIIHVADMLPGEGTSDQPWQLTPEVMFAAVKQLTWTRKTIFFRAGIYNCPQPIEINFAHLFPLTIGPEQSVQDDPAFKMLREGVRFVGEGRASVLRFQQQGTDAIQFHIHWSVTPLDQRPKRQAPLFFWEFTGLNLQGNVNTALVQFGGPTVEDSPWNSCVFDIAVNNGYRLSAFSEGSGNARGVVLKRVLQSRVELVATCHSGIACVLDECEFCTINGSFSNGEVEDPDAPRGVAISRHGIGLYLHNCTGNGSTSINFEVAYEGLRMHGHSRGNAFGSMVSNNCDARGCVINDDMTETGMRNMVQCVVRRDVRQQEHTWQPLFSSQSRGSVAVLHNMI